MPDSIFDIEFSPYKSLVHWDRINDLAAGRDAAPVTLELDISSMCTHRCKWCVDPAGSHTGVFIPVSTVMRILDESRELGIRGVVFKGGGESTLHPDFPAILKAAREMGFETGVVTNGSRLDSSDVTDALANYASYVRVSVDGPDRESRMAVHGVDDIEVLSRGLRELVKKRGIRRHPVIGATFCIDYSMKDLAGKCVDFGEAAELDYVLVRPPFCEEVGYMPAESIGQIRELREAIMEAARNHTGNVRVMAGNWIGDREMKETRVKDSAGLARRDLRIDERHYNGIEHITRRCLASRLFLLITAELEAFGCCCLRNMAGYSFGKIDYEKGVTIESVLNGSQRAHAAGKMERAACLDHCTHPLSKINEVIEYLRLPEKYHSSFI